MNILDALIIVLIIISIIGGLSRGFIKETVLLIGMILIIVLSWYLKNPVASFLYKHLPFFNFPGILKGVAVVNILLYEVLAFLIIISILYLILRIILKVTGLIETLLKATIILGFFSKILGGIVGFIEGYILVFIILFITSQPFLNVTGIKESRVANFMLDHTPVMSNAVSDYRTALKEIEDLKSVYKTDSKEFNNKAIELFLKYNIISEENLNYLVEKGKIKITN